MGLKTPVKKALGEKNTFVRKDGNGSNSNVTQEGSMSMIDTDGLEQKNDREYLKIEDGSYNRDSNPNVAID